MSASGRTTEYNLPYMLTDEQMSEVDNQRFGVGIDNQLTQLAQLWGDGVFGSTSWEVSAGTGLVAAIAAGAGLVDGFAGLTGSSQNITLNDNADNFIWATPHVDGETDMAWVRTPTFVVYPASTGYTGLVLARVGTESGSIKMVGDPGEEEADIEDLRREIGQEYLAGLIADLQTDTAQLFAALGAAYADYGGTPDTVDDRLTSLETIVAGMDPGDRDAIKVYWGDLEKSTDDSRTIESWHYEYHQAQDAAKLGGIRRIDWDTAVCSLLAELIHEVGRRGQSAMQGQRNVYIFHPATSPEAYYDAAHTTATINREDGLIQ
ncbi:MAG: hypothetical protein GF320_02460 [Armatimonadia bacterium]|nr:hypothetical protein [Armatimonadia bacterium]